MGGTDHGIAGMQEQLTFRARIRKRRGLPEPLANLQESCPRDNSPAAMNRVRVDRCGDFVTTRPSSDQMLLPPSEHIRSQWPERAERSEHTS